MHQQLEPSQINIRLSCQRIWCIHGILTTVIIIVFPLVNFYLSVIVAFSHLMLYVITNVITAMIVHVYFGFNTHPDQLKNCQAGIILGILDCGLL